jgi:hypothetical protein
MPTPARTAWMSAWEGDLTPSAAAERSATRTARAAAARIPDPVPEAERSVVPTELHEPNRHRPRWGIVLLALTFAGLLLSVLIIAPLMINSAVTAMEAQVGQMEAQQQGLTTIDGALSARVSALSSPTRVAEQAAQLGLGPAQSVHYIEAGSGVAATEGDTTVAGR